MRASTSRSVRRLRVKHSLFAGVPVLFATWITACAPGTDPAPPESLVGAWNWVESTGGIAGVTQTPASTGRTMTLTFTRDGLARLTSSDGPERTVSFTAVRRAGGTVELAYGEPLMGFESQTASFGTGGALLLTDPCCDGFTYPFAPIVVTDG